MKITVQTTVAAPIEAVWRAYNAPEDIRQWNTASEDWHTTESSVDLRVGGAFSSRMEAKDGSMGFDFAGTYTKVEPHKRIEYTFGERYARVEFEPGPTGVTVRVSFDAESAHSVEQQQQGWQAILDSFARHVECLQKEGAHDIMQHPLHLGLGASVAIEPLFTGAMDWYADYGTRHAADGAEGRLVSMYTFSEPWTMWEMHPLGHEVVLCTAGVITLHQQAKGGAVTSVTLNPGQYAINEPGVWHTADVQGEATALFITAGMGTEHRAR